MKNRDVSHWNNNEFFDGMLLFVEALEEAAFYYSFESYKIPALNCHYLCYDILKTADGINQKVLMDGNFVPLAEEFELLLQEDTLVNRITGDGIVFLAKDKNSKYYSLINSDSKSKIKGYSEIASYIKDWCEVQNGYLSILIEEITENIFVDNFAFENMDAIYKSTRKLVTELVNGGYSKEYIYQTVLNYFHNPEIKIECTAETVSSFFELFSFSEFDYQIVIGVNTKAATVFKLLEAIEVRKPTPKEKELLNLQKSKDCVAVLELSALDEYSAYARAADITNMIKSLHRVNKHDESFYLSLKGLISRKSENGNIETRKVISSPQNPMKKKGNAPDLHALFDDVTLINHIELPNAFLRAISLHNGAIESKDVSNQLLNLWTIIEVLIDTKRDNEDRINTICSVMCSLLNRCYLYTNIEQLLRDVEVCIGEEFESIVSGIEFPSDDFDNVEKLTLILSAKEYQTQLDMLKEKLSPYPLLKYRIIHFSEYVFADSISIYEYLKRHENRIRWHIMRIYRNRNMIVHSGSHMPYIDIIVENLHYYVDMLLDTLIEYYLLGIMKHSTIFKDISIGEAAQFKALGVNLVGKSKGTAVCITKENALKLILNGYNGNVVKKAFDRAKSFGTGENTLSNPDSTCENEEV